MRSKNIAEDERFAMGRQAERNGQFKEAINHYELLLKKKPAHIGANNRLMVVYRKLREYAKESLLIKNAIHSLEQETENKLQDYIAGHPEKARDTKILAMSLGLLNEKGLPIIENEVADKWKNRLALLAKKFNDKTTKNKS